MTDIVDNCFPVFLNHVKIDRVANLVGWLLAHATIVLKTHGHLGLIAFRLTDIALHILQRAAILRIGDNVVAEWLIIFTVISVICQLFLGIAVSFGKVFLTERADQVLTTGAELASGLTGPALNQAG